MEKIIEIKHLNFSYPDGTEALRDIGLDIFARETLGIIGPNGAGKSTFLLHLNGLLNGNSAVRIFGQEMTKKNLSFIRQKVGVIFQDPQDQLFMPTIYEDVAFGPQNLGLPPKKVEALVTEALEAVGLNEKRNHLSYHLSIGEQKRASIATVLSMSPEILVLDEPNSNLDPVSRRQLINILRGLTITKVIATHDLELVLELCSRVVVLDHGRIVAIGLPQEILADKSLMESHGLEIPLSLALSRTALCVCENPLS